LKTKIHILALPSENLYYIDKSVLVENRPLVKFIENYIRDSSGKFSTSSLVRISMTSSPTLTLVKWLPGSRRDPGKIPVGKMKNLAGKRNFPAETLMGSWQEKILAGILARIPARVSVPGVILPRHW